jgi:hypothetical protein
VLNHVGGGEGGGGGHLTGTRITNEVACYLAADFHSSAEGGKRGQMADPASGLQLHLCFMHVKDSCRPSLAVCTPQDRGI